MSDKKITEAELQDEIFLSEREAEQKVIDDLTAERNDYKNKYLYALAEISNIKKRHESEKPGWIELGSIKVAYEILNIIDDFQRALDNNESVEDTQLLKDSFELLYDKFVKSMDKLNIKRIQALGEEFDTEKHEAVGTVPVTGRAKANIVDKVVQDGYMFNDKVIRHAKVIVTVKAD